MTLIYAGAALGILVVMLLALIRGFIGPSVYDRVLAANASGPRPCSSSRSTVS